MDLKIRKNKHSYTISDICRSYNKQYGTDVPYFCFKTILNEFNQNIKESILNRSELFKMPFGLGYIVIAKYRPKTYTSKSLSIDYKSSKEEVKVIYYLNEHSDGYKYRLYWSKIPKTFVDRYKYQLNLVRENKRYLAKLIFNKQDYKNINDIQIYKM